MKIRPLFVDLGALPPSLPTASQPQILVSVAVAPGWEDGRQFPYAHTRE